MTSRSSISFYFFGFLILSTQSAQSFYIFSSFMTSKSSISFTSALFPGTQNPPLQHTHTYTYNKNIYIIYMILYAFYISYYIHIYVYFKHSLIFLTYTFHEDFQQHTPGISRPYTFFSRIFNNILQVYQDHT
jgi:hypothetical protein